MLSLCLVDFEIYTILIQGFLCLSFFFYSPVIFAQGVTAGTEVSNIAVVNYMIGNVIQEPIESSPTGNSSPSVGQGTTTKFIVDRNIDLVLTGNNNASVTPGDFQSEVTYTLLNEGNDIQTYQLIPNGSIISDIFDTSSCSTSVTAVSGTPLAGVTLPTSGNIKLSPDQQASISVKCDIPLTNGAFPISTGDTSFVSLAAITLINGDGSPTIESNVPDNAALIETVFSDDTGTDDSLRDAKHSARRTYTATTSSIPPTLSINKSILGVSDPNGGNNAITGSEVSYKIKITTQGTGVLDGVVITDITPVEMSYKPSSIKLDGAILTDNFDTDEGDFGITSSNTVTVDLGNINAGTQHEIQLTYIIN